MTRNGVTYIYVCGRTGTTLCISNRGGEWHSTAGIGVVPPKNDNEAAYKFESALLSGHVNQAYAWVDRNGDGLATENELSFRDYGNPRPLIWCYWGTLPDSDGSITYAASDGQK